MNTQAKADEYTAKSLHFYDRAKFYEQTGCMRMAEELKDAARAFAEAASYLSQPGLHDLPFEGESCVFHTREHAR